MQEDRYHSAYRTVIFDDGCEYTTVFTYPYPMTTEESSQCRGDIEAHARQVYEQFNDNHAHCEEEERP